MSTIDSSTQVTIPHAKLVAMRRALAGLLRTHRCSSHAAQAAWQAATAAYLDAFTVEERARVLVHAREFKRTAPASSFLHSLPNFDTFEMAIATLGTQVIAEALGADA